MIQKLRYLRAAINTWPRALPTGVYYFLKVWETEIQLMLMDQNRSLQ